MSMLRLVFASILAMFGMAQTTAAQTIPLQGPGLGNLTYTPAELFKSISVIKPESQGGDVPPRGSACADLGVEIGGMVNGYFVTMFAPDHGCAIGGFLVYDVSNPRNPVLKKKIYEPTGRTKDFKENHAFTSQEVNGKDYVVVPTGTGIEIWDFTDINDIKRAKLLLLPGVNYGGYDNVTWQAFWQAPYIYVSGANHGIYIVDATVPENAFLANRGAGRPNPVPPSEYGGFRLGAIYAMGNLMYGSASTSDGFSTLDISDPLNPRVLATGRAGRTFYSTCFDGQKAYTSSQGGGQRIHGFDWSDPNRFVAETSTLAKDEMLYCATQDNFLFQGAQFKIHKIDISNPASYVQVGEGSLSILDLEHSDHGQVAPMSNLAFVGNDHGSGSGFIVHSTSPDTTPPAVKAVSPKNGVQFQAVTSRVGIGLTDTVKSETVNAQTFVVRRVGGQPLAGTYSAQLGIINFTPAEKLLPGATYEVVLPANGIRDLAGNGLAQEFKSTFTTRAVDKNIVNRWPLSRDLKDQVRGNNGTAGGSDVYAEGGLNFANRTGGVQLQSDEIAATLGATSSLVFYMKTSQTTTQTMPWMAPGIFGKDIGGAFPAGYYDITWGWLDNQGFLNLSTGLPGEAGNPGTKSSVRVNDNVWHHVAMTRDSVTGAQTMYIDGVKTSSAGRPGAMGLTDKFSLLGQVQGNAEFYRGILRDVRVYDRVLSDGDVAQLRSEKPLAYHWPLSQDLKDQVRGNDGTAGSSDVFVDGGLNFANRTGGVTLANDQVSDVLGGTASLSLFLRTSQTTPNNVPWSTPGIFGRDRPGNKPEGWDDISWGWLDNQGYLNLSTGLPGEAGNTGTKTSAPVNDGAWHHVVMTRDATSGVQTVYLDGVKTTTTGTAGVFGLNSKFNLLGQIQGNADFFKGTLADVRVYDRVLSDADVAVLRAQRPVVFPPKTTGASVQFNPAQLGISGATYVWNFGDGTTLTTTSANPIANHTYATPGHYTVTVRVIQASGEETTHSYMVPVTRPLTASAPTHSTTITSDGTSVYNINPDHGTVTAIDAQTLAKRWEVSVGAEPATLAKAPDGNIWVAVQGEDKLVALRANGTVAQTVTLAYGSGPHGIVFTPNGSKGLVTLESKAQLTVFNPSTGAITQTLNLPAGSSPRGIAATGDSNTAYITRFKSLMTKGELYKVNLTTMAAPTTINLQVDTTSVDNEAGARGVPNYMHQVVISPDGARAVLPSKKDNIVAGLFRDGVRLRHDTTVRSILSQIDLAGGTELFSQQIDFNDGAPARAAVFSPLGDYIFVAQMEGNRVEMVDAYNGSSRAQINSGDRAPNGLYLDAARKRLFVNNFLSRDVTAYDVSAMLSSQSSVPSLVGTVRTAAGDPLTMDQWQGKVIFYGAADTRMSRHGYMSCASCHVDGGDDGMVWDFTQRGEGLRRTISLQGRQGMGHGNVHWTANFNEIQDFENDIRGEFGGTGFMSNTDFQATQNPLGAAKAGKSADLDRLAAFVSTLDKFPRSPARSATGCLTAEAQAGQTTYNNAGCTTCHSGTTLRDGVRHDVGTIQPSSGTGIGQPLAGVGFDTPTLYGVWDTAPYFHNGRAASLNDVFTVGVHANNVPANQVAGLVAYLRSLDQRNQCTTQ